MLKVPRFMKEYANYRKRFIKDNVLNKESMVESIYRIDKVLSAYKNGIIPVTEAMQEITRA